MHITFDKSAHCSESRSATDQMNLLPVSQLSYFLQSAIMHEAQVLDLVKRNTPIHEKRLLALAEIKSARIAKNHAQIMALADGLADLLKLPQQQLEEIHSCLEALAIERQQAIITDHPVVQLFWDTYEYLNNDHDRQVLNHSRSPDFIAININHFVEVATQAKQQIPLITDLKTYLKGSKARPFAGIKAVNSAIATTEFHAPKTVKCWTFERRAT